MSNKQLNIGLFGFGVVGKGLYDILHTTQPLQASIKKIITGLELPSNPLPHKNLYTAITLKLILH